ncbi:hypothetical protein D049_2324B, partial [Vibrio parahaemolyticus VPTS-2010]
YHQTHAK